MSTHNICFHGEIRKIIHACGYPLLSGATDTQTGINKIIPMQSMNKHVKANIFKIFLNWEYRFTCLVSRARKAGLSSQVVFLQTFPR